MKITRNVYKCYNSELGNNYKWCARNMSRLKDRKKMEYKWGYKLYRSPRTEELADQGSDHWVNMQLRLAKQETELWKVAVGKVRKKPGE